MIDVTRKLSQRIHLTIDSFSEMFFSSNHLVILKTKQGILTIGFKEIFDAIPNNAL